MYTAKQNLKLIDQEMVYLSTIPVKDAGHYASIGKQKAYLLEQASVLLDSLVAETRNSDLINKNYFNQ